MEKINIKSGKETIIHHLDAFLENNLEELLTDYTPHSVIVTQQKKYSGLIEIKDFFNHAFLLFPAEDTKITVDTLTQVDNLVFIIWHGKTKDFVIPFSTATYVLKDGKIMYHTIARVNGITK
jgi:hypothetical protein